MDRDDPATVRIVRIDSTTAHMNIEIFQETAPVSPNLCKSNFDISWSVIIKTFCGGGRWGWNNGLVCTWWQVTTNYIVMVPFTRPSTSTTPSGRM